MIRLSVDAPEDIRFMMMNLRQFITLKTQSVSRFLKQEMIEMIA